FSADATRLRIFLGDRRFEPTGGPASGAAQRPAEAPVPVVDAVRGSGAAQRPAEAPVPVVDAVRGQLAAVLGIDRPAAVNLAESLFDLGIDSMLAVDLRKRLKRVVGRTVSLATLMGEITGDELVAQLSESGHSRD
ncbi:acyl carrier protein, partial [Mycobacterium palustre]|uniref:acyl carrier protein n=1 Tax=Mycobacterium palustre TaxID=153971 RepID=UPI0021F37541